MSIQERKCCGLNLWINLCKLTWRWGHTTVHQGVNCLGSNNNDGITTGNSEIRCRCNIGP